MWTKFDPRINKTLREKFTLIFYTKFTLKSLQFYVNSNNSSERANIVHFIYRTSQKIRRGLILIFVRKITPGPISEGYHLFSFIKNKIVK